MISLQDGSHGVERLAAYSDIQPFGTSTDSTREFFTANSDEHGPCVLKVYDEPSLGTFAWEVVFLLHLRDEQCIVNLVDYFWFGAGRKLAYSNTAVDNFLRHRKGDEEPEAHRDG